MHRLYSRNALSVVSLAFLGGLALAVSNCLADTAVAQHGTNSVGGSDESAFERAMHLLDDGKPNEARPILESLHRRHPQSYEISESLGLLYASAGDFKLALPLLESAVHAAPSTAVAHANLGTDDLKLGRNADAATELERASALNPSDAQTQNALGQVLVLNKEPCKAAEAFAKAAEHASPDADLSYNRGLAQYQCNRPEQALAVLNAMPGLDSSAAAQSLLGDIDEQQKRFKEAAEHYLRATQIEPSEANLYTFGVDLLRHWSFDPAIRTFSDGVNAYPNSQRMLSGLGIADYGAAHYDEAIHVFAGLLENDPDDALYGEVYGRACTVLTDNQDPLCANLTALAQNHPKDANLALYAAIAILHEPDDPQKLMLAKDLLHTALHTDPHLAEAHYQLGVLLQRQERWADSIGELQLALAQDPNFARAHYRLGLAYSHSGRKEDAQREMSLDRAEDQQQHNDLNARMQQITTLLVKMP